MVYTSQPRGKGAIITISAIVKALKRLNDVKLVIKPHPAEDASICKNLLRELEYDAIVSQDIDLYEIIICSDLLISMNSTTLLEALALGTPAIQLDLIEKYDLFGELANKCIKIVNEESKLYGAIKETLSEKYLSKELSKKRKKFISEYYYKIDGNSTKRFIGLINELLVKNKKMKKDSGSQVR